MYLMSPLFCEKGGILFKGGHCLRKYGNLSPIFSRFRPSLLITDAYNASYQMLRRRARDEQLMTLILQTLRGGGNALVCVDTAGNYSDRHLI